MIRSQYLSTLAIAALIGAAPAFAQTSPSSTMKEPTAATQKAEAKSSAKTKARTQAQTSAATSATKPMCSELNHPDAAKLADKDTGMAKDSSRSPVHLDCIADAQAGAGVATESSSSATLGTEAPATGSPSSSTGNTLDSSGTLSTNPTPGVNPSIGVEASKGVGNPTSSEITGQGKGADQSSTKR